MGLSHNFIAFWSLPRSVKRKKKRKTFFHVTSAGNDFPFILLVISADPTRAASAESAESVLDNVFKLPET